MEYGGISTVSPVSVSPSPSFRLIDGFHVIVWHWLYFQTSRRKTNAPPLPQSAAATHGRKRRQPGALAEYLSRSQRATDGLPDDRFFQDYVLSGGMRFWQLPSSSGLEQSMFATPRRHVPLEGEGTRATRGQHEKTARRKTFWPILAIAFRYCFMRSMDHCCATPFGSTACHILVDLPASALISELTRRLPSSEFFLACAIASFG